MSRVSVAGPERQPAARSYSTATRISLMRVGDCGQARGARPGAAARAGGAAPGPGPPAGGALVLALPPHLADARRRLRPAARLDHRLGVLLVRAARHLVVGLVRQARPADAPFRGGAEGGERRA